MHFVARKWGHLVPRGSNLSSTVLAHSAFLGPTCHAAVVAVKQGDDEKEKGVISVSPGRARLTRVTNPTWMLVHGH